MTGASRPNKRGLDLTGADQRFRDRFWAKVDKTGDCWTWTAYRQKAGYGQFTVTRGVFYGAHRVSYALTHGHIPPSMSVCHHCDNPSCVKPAHLFLGTPSDNSRDMFAKGRATRSRGEERKNAVLTEDAVRRIRSAPPARALISDLAREYGCSATTIDKVRRGKKWRHVQ